LIGKKQIAVKSPPMMVNGTTATMPARMADKSGLSLKAVKPGTRCLLMNAVALFIHA
jgi:hypothetical protein